MFTSKTQGLRRRNRPPLIRPKRGVKKLLTRFNVFLSLAIAGNGFFFLGQRWGQGDVEIIVGEGDTKSVLTVYGAHSEEGNKFVIEDESAFQLNQSKSKMVENEDAKAINIENASGDTSDRSALDRCSFRRYPSDRYYDLGTPLVEQPSFLSDALYIRGEIPTVLNPPIKDSDHQAPVKVCVDTSEWEDVSDTARWPFTDGHNPSVMSLAANPALLLKDDEKEKSSVADRVRLNPESVAPIADLYGGQSKLEHMYIGLSVMGNGQCSWKMSAEKIEEYNFSTLKEAPTKRSMILILDKSLEKIGQTTIFLELDAKFGTRRGSLNAKPLSDGSGYERSIVELDDIRLFFYKGAIWVLYRNGPKFGYEDQLQNRLHFESITQDNGSKSFGAYIKASETVKVCCGRNMALISEDPISGDDTLKALTWVDPVTVAEVDLSMLPANTASNTAQKLRRLTEYQSNDQGHMKNDDSGQHVTEQNRRRLGAIKSHIHGTNGYMIPLHSTGELLGIAHFHRPEKRDTSDYALHGHHYTHVLFTIGKKESDSDGYELKRISNEFLFRSIFSPTEEIDGDIIQFASGLDLVGSDKHGKLLISYGINDCEGAAFFLDMQVVQDLLLDIGDANEVVDLMEIANK